jgi:hypothetical protein
MARALLVRNSAQCKEPIALLDAVGTQGDLAAHVKKFPGFYGDLAASVIRTRVNRRYWIFLRRLSQVLGPLYLCYQPKRLEPVGQYSFL